MLYSPGNSHILPHPVRRRQDVGVSHPDVGGVARALEAVGGGENGIAVEQGSATHHLRVVTQEYQY